jgi:hypothetical protein
MSRRQSAGWGSTNETSFTLLALTDYLLERETGAAETGYTVELNGRVVADGRLGRGEPAAAVEITAGQMAAGDNTLRVTQRGDGKLYYVIHQRVFRPQAEIEAAGGIRLERVYLDPRSQREITGAVAAGQLVKVVLRVEMPRLGAYMIVEDRLPGGLEALNEGLNTTGHDAQAEASCFDYNGCQVFNWQSYGYNNKEVRGDRVSFFITGLSAGRATFAYLARATRAGEFVALPAEAHAMYDLTLWGRSASDEVAISH